jgi:hypothetical protein
MYPTRAQIKTRFQSLLDDPSGAVFSEAVFAEAFGEAYDALYTAFLTNQCPRIELLLPVIVPALTTALTPAQMGISDFGDYIYLAERIYGTQDDYRDMAPVDRLAQRPMTDRLLEYNYRNDTFYFVGATNTVEIQVKYDTSGQAPTDDATQVAVDGSLTFLSNYAVGIAGGRKGYDSVAQRCMNLAVGPKYDLGTIGGELFRIIQPRVRSRQKVQIAPKPYSAFRRLLAQRGIPYVAAQQGATGGGAQNVPIQFSSATGTIVGTIDGVNAVFTLTIGGVLSMAVYRNGVLQTAGTDYTALNNQITFAALSIPQPGDIVTAEVYLNYN